MIFAIRLQQTSPSLGTKKTVMKSKYILPLLATALILASIISCSPFKKEENSVDIAKAENDKNLGTRKDEKDADFIVDAVAENYAEIKMAQMALVASTSEEVKEIARTLEADHTKALTELKGYANKNGISIPMEESEKAKIKIEDLSEKGVEDFDRKWCSLLIGKHENTIRNLEYRWNKTEDPELKDWVNKTLPVLNGHLDMLKEHEKKMKELKAK